MVAAVDEASAPPRPSAPSAPSFRPGEGYRPHLDGLRAIAVYLVILFHAGAARFSGGFIGVDVFFVLSGYLVTQLLVRDLRSQGRIRFGRFYARRMRRLLPASAAALLITAVVYSAIASRVDIASAVNAFKAAFLYVANWFFIRRSADYFAANINTNPVIHFWSLAVEEQFYFLWPLLLSGLYLLTRGFRANANRALQIAVALGALVSMLWALHLAGENLNRAYYGTDARAYQLLAGALIALSPGIVRRLSRYRVAELAAPVALGVLLVLATSAINMTPIHRGIATAITASVLIIAIESARRGPVNKVLSADPVVYLGRISYGTYLWHWPVIFVATQLVPGISALSAFAVSAFVATGLASLSYHVLERPVRQDPRLDRANLVVVGIGLGIAVVAALVVIPRVLGPHHTHGTVAQASTTVGFTPIPPLDFATARVSVGPNLHGVAFPQNCVGKPSSACTIVKGTGEHILVIGDSHTEMFAPTFAKIAQLHHLTLSIASGSGCPWQRDVYPAEDNIPQDQVFKKQCVAFKKDLYDRVIPELKPDLIVAISNDYLTRRPGAVTDAAGKVTPANSPYQLAALEKADSAKSLRLLEQYTHKVLVVEPVPTTTLPNDPLVCLTKKKFLEDCRFVAVPEPTPLQLIYRGLADEKTVFVANFSKLVCPYFPICDPVISGMIVRFDNQHITGAFAVSLAPEVTSFLQNAGLLPA